MKMQRWTRLIAGSFILVSLLFAITVSKWWLLLTAFIGANLAQSAFTGWCLMEKILKQFGVQGCCDKE